MKTKAITIASGSIFDPALEEIIQKKDAELKELARKNAKSFAERNQPSPASDSLSFYTGEIKAGYERLASDANHQLQPAANFPEAKVDADFFKEKDRKLEAEIKTLEDRNYNDYNEHNLGQFNQSSIPTRIRWALIITFVITLSEVAFNTMAFQILGGSKLSAFIISLGVSLCIFLFSHFVPFLYKKAKTVLQRRAVLWGSLAIVVLVFIGIGMLRTAYLASHGVSVNPVYFVLINLFFFIVSTLLSFFVLPSWSELKESALRLKVLRLIKKRKEEIERLKIEREKIKETVLERTKLRIRIADLANSVADRIRKMYFESMEIFKTTNLSYRTDRITPDCFWEALPEPNIEDFTYSITTNTKQQ